MSKGTGTPLINKKGGDQRQCRKARKENTMTNREFFTAIAAMENLSEELIQHAEAELEKLNKRNTARAAKPTKAQKENEPIKEEIVKFLTEKGGFHTASEVMEACEISVQKASALCRQLVEEGALTVQEIKVPKKGKQKAYAIADNSEEVTE